MFVAVFRSRLNPLTLEQYQATAQRLAELVKTMPGYISHKSFEAPDKERVTVVEFESEEALHRWATEPAHVEAKKLGRTTLFTQYRLQVCNVVRDTGIKAPAPGAAQQEAG